MMWLILGLVVFLGVHSLRIVAEDWREHQIARWGEGRWKGLYSVVSLLGFALILWGYGLARQQPVLLWPAPPTGLRHAASLLTLAAFVLLAAAYVPGNAIKAVLRHPMVLAVKLWALAHLLVNNSLADALLFGGFLVWAVFSFRAARARDRENASSIKPGTTLSTALTVALGVLAWAIFALWLHAAWIGVRPFGI